MKADLIAGPIETEKVYMIPVAVEVAGADSEDDAATLVGIKLNKGGLVEGWPPEGTEYGPEPAGRIDSWKTPNNPAADGNDSEERLVWVPKDELRWSLFQIAHHLRPIHGLIEDVVGRPMADEELDDFILQFHGGYAGTGWLGTYNLAVSQLRDALIDAGIAEDEDTLHCDYCENVENAGDLTPDWNGETGNHLSCEERERFRQHEENLIKHDLPGDR